MTWASSPSNHRPAYPTRDAVDAPRRRTSGPARRAPRRASRATTPPRRTARARALERRAGRPRSAADDDPSGCSVIRARACARPAARRRDGAGRAARCEVEPRGAAGERQPGELGRVGVEQPEPSRSGAASASDAEPGRAAGATTGPGTAPSTRRTNVSAYSAAPRPTTRAPRSASGATSAAARPTAATSTVDAAGAVQRGTATSRPRGGGRRWRRRRPCPPAAPATPPTAIASRLGTPSTGMPRPSASVRAVTRPDAQAGERRRAGADDDGGELAPVDARLGEDRGDHRGEQLGVVPLLRVGPRGEHVRRRRRSGRPRRRRRCRGRGRARAQPATGDVGQGHVRPPVHRRRAPSRRARRRPRRPGRRRRSRPRAAAAASPRAGPARAPSTQPAPHSTTVTDSSRLASRSSASTSSSEPSR